jgi:hypothetical protein
MQFTQQFGVETKMKICREEKKEKAAMVFKAGRLYENEVKVLYFCADTRRPSKVLVNVKSGVCITDLSNLTSTYTDVTDQYCLQEK